MGLLPPIAIDRMLGARAICIKPQDLQLKGEFFAMTYDQAIMFPNIDDILYIYNMENLQNDNKVDPALQMMIEKHVGSQQPYQALTAILKFLQRSR